MVARKLVGEYKRNQGKRFCLERKIQQPRQQKQYKPDQNLFKKPQCQHNKTQYTAIDWYTLKLLPLLAAFKKLKRDHAPHYKQRQPPNKHKSWKESYKREPRTPRVALTNHNGSKMAEIVWQNRPRRRSSTESPKLPRYNKRKKLSKHQDQENCYIQARPKIKVILL